MSAPRFGLRIPPCAAASEVARCVADAERAGFDTAWIPDSQFIWRDVWATMAVAAGSTSAIELGTCVTNLETRHPTVTAAAAATVEELAPGRVVLGVGAGDSAVKTLGLKPTRLEPMRNETKALRQLLAGEQVEFSGRPMRLKRPPSTRVPVYLAATAPKMLALAGELADGVIVLRGLSPALIDRTLEQIGAGARAAGRSLDELEICFGALVHVAENELDAVRAVKPYVAAIAQTGGADVLRAAGIEVEVPTGAGGVYPDLSHAEDWEAAVEAAGPWVSDEAAARYADAFCLVGPADKVAAGLEAAIDHGARSFYIRHLGSYTLPDELVEAFGSTILPRLR